MHGLQETRRARPLSLYVALLVTAAVIVVIDQVTKALALDHLSDGPVDVIEGILTLRLTYNPGGAFGVLQGVPNFFLIATTVIVIFILYWARTVQVGGLGGSPRAGARRRARESV